MNTRTFVRVRRSLAIIGILSILSTLVVSIPTAGAYSGADAKKAGLEWAEKAVDEACESEIIDCSLADPKFSEVVNRAVGYQMLTKGFEVWSETAKSPLTGLGDWYDEAFHTAYTLGWTKGDPPPAANPGGPLTRAQLSVAAAAVLGLEADEKGLEGYKDAKEVPSFAKGPMGAMVKAKLIGQGTDKMLNPNKGAIKAEVIVVLNAQVKYAGDNEIDVLEVAAERAGVDADTIQEALDTGMNVVDGELQEVELAVDEDEEEGDEDEEGDEEDEEEAGDEDEGGEEEPGGEDATPPPPPPPAGTLTVSVASDTPAVKKVLADTTSGDGAEALVHFTHFKFATDAGSSAKVTKLKLKRLGISSDSDISNLYLYGSDGVRLAEVNNIASTYFTFENSSGLFTVTGEKVVYVVGDIANGTGASKTIGFGLVGVQEMEKDADGKPTTVAIPGKYEDVGSDATTVSGTFPANGVLMETTTVADLGRLTINGTSSPSSVDPGKTDFEVWRFNFVGNDQDISVSKVNLTLIGTVASSDIKNIKLFSSGKQLGSTVDQVNSSNEALFDLSASPLKLTAGQTSVIEVRADIVGGTSRNFRFAIRKSSDIDVRDSNYNVSLKPNQTNTLTVIEPTTNTSINSGRLTIQRTLDSPAATVANNANAVTLAKFSFGATGEGIKVETIVIEAVVSDDDENLNNGKLFVDGVQVGTTVDFDSDATDDGDFTDSATDAEGGGGTDEDTSITLGNTFIIPAGTTKTLSLVADTKDGSGDALDGSPTIRLSIGGIVATGQISVSTLSVSSTDGNQLTAVSGALTTSKNISMADPTAVLPSAVPGATCIKVASFVVQAGAGEAVNMTQLILTDDYDGTSTDNLSDMWQNLKVVKSGASCSNPGSGEQIGSTVTSLTDTDATTYTFSVSPALRINAGDQAIFDVYADFLSSISAQITNCIGLTSSGCTETDGLLILDSVNGTGVSTSSAANDATDRQLHTIRLATSGTLTITTASTSPSSTLFAGTDQEVELAHFSLKETTGAEGIKITDVTVTNVSSASTAFYRVGIFVDGVQLGGYQNFGSATNGTAAFTGLSYVVPANTTKTLVVKAKSVVHPSGTANSDHAMRLAASGVTARGATSNTSTNGPAAAVDANTHSWARTGLTATGGLVAGDCTTSCVRGSSDNIFSLGLTSGSPYGATLRGALQANDEADNGTDTDNWVGGTSTALAVTTTAGRYVDGSGAIQVTPSALLYGSNSLMYDFGTSTHLLNYSKVSFWLWVGSGYFGTSTTGQNQWFFKACADAGSTTPANTSARLAVAGATNSFNVGGDATRAFCPQVSQINGGAAFPNQPNGALFYVELDTTLGATSTRWFGVEAPPVVVAATTSLAFAIDDLRLWNDSVTVNLSGSLAGTNTYMGSTTVEAVDGSDVIQLVGYVTPTGTTGAANSPAKAVLTSGRDIGNATTTSRADIQFTTAATTYKIRAETDALMAVDTTAAETLSVSIGLGGATSNGDIRWYDGAVGTGSPLTWVSGTTPITVNYSY